MNNKKEISPDFFLEINKLSAPDFIEHPRSNPLLLLIDAQLSITSNIKAQLSLIQDLVVNIKEGGKVDIKADSLFFLSENILRQTSMIELSANEIHRISK
jgi:hypothetical protein